jgi:hypothetical protein
MNGWSNTTIAWSLIAAGALFCAGSATAKEEPFGQETVEIRQPRNPPAKHGATDKHRTHRHGATAQVWGRAPGEPGALDLDNFTRYQAKLRLVAHF